MKSAISLSYIPYFFQGGCHNSDKLVIIVEVFLIKTVKHKYSCNIFFINLIKYVWLFSFYRRSAPCPPAETYCPLPRLPVSMATGWCPARGSLWPRVLATPRPLCLAALCWSTRYRTMTPLRSERGGDPKCWSSSGSIWPAPPPPPQKGQPAPQDILYIKVMIYEI